MQDIIIKIMDQFGYIGILFLIAIENIFPPIPSEVILTFGGFMTTYTKNMTPTGVIIAATLGSILGAIILYGIGRCFTEETLDRWLSGKWGRLLGFKKGDVVKAVGWFTKRGKITVLFCRCIPIIRSLISIPAGIAKMEFGLFFIYTLIGSFVWNIVLVSLGVAAGASWEIIAGYIDAYSHITLYVLAALFIVIASIFIIKRRSSTKNKDDNEV